MDLQAKFPIQAQALPITISVSSCLYFILFHHPKRVSYFYASLYYLNLFHAYCHNQNDDCDCLSYPRVSLLESLNSSLRGLCFPSSIASPLPLLLFTTTPP